MLLLLFESSVLTLADWTQLGVKMPATVTVAQGSTGARLEGGWQLPPRHPHTPSVHVVLRIPCFHEQILHNTLS